MHSAATTASSALGGVALAATRRHGQPAARLSPRRLTTTAKLAIVGGDGPQRKPAQPPAALPQAAVAFSPAQLRDLQQPAAEQQAGQQPPRDFLDQVERLEKSFSLSPAEEQRQQQRAAAAAAAPAAAADSLLQDVLGLLGDLDDLSTQLDSAVATSSELATLTEEDLERLEGQRRKEEERRRTSEQRARQRRIKAKGTTSSTRATRASSSSSSSKSSSSAAKPAVKARREAVVAAAAAAAPVAAASGRVGASSARPSAAASSAVPFTGAAARSAARTQRVRQWGRTEAAVGAGGIAAGLSKRAAAAASLEADPHTFIRSISTSVLLTADQEKRLAGFVQDRLSLVEAAARFKAAQGRPPSEAEWVAAARCADGGELRERLALGLQARELMVSCNMRLVVSIAKKYVGRGLTLQDLVAEGMVGLHRGVDKFDASKGFKFSTYAHWWIRQAVTRSLSDQARVVRLPVHLHEAMSRVRRAEQTLWEETGMAPSPEAVARRCGLSQSKLVALYKAFRNPTSREAGPSGGTLVDESKAPGESWVEEAEEEDDPAELAHQRMMKEDMNSVLLTLTERESGILKMRYGLDDGHEKTLEEVGRAFNVTRERIRQIEAKAIRKLRSPSRLGQLVHL